TAKREARTVDGYIEGMMCKRSRTLALLLGLGLILHSGCLFSTGQRYCHFTTATPLPCRQFLVLGFMGGREPWDNDRNGVRKLALKLRAMPLPAAVETVENTKRDLALQLIHKALDRNRDGDLSEEERRSARIILYGQSFGGAAVVKLARQLQKRQIPVLLTVQIDSVGRGDALIPSNVRRAANLFQKNGLIIRGEPEIRAQDAEKTTIVGNFRFDYSRKRIDLKGIPWHKRLFRTAHAKMDRDPEVWTKVEALIFEDIEKSLAPSR
ncbi:MAG: hypothetical protein V3T83_15065, partial [Acidobacteriota bacterium]